MDRTVYPVELTDEEWSRLQAVFPEGVCDGSQPGVGQVPLEGTWLRF
jgi:transposase